jgi:RING-box protein 1
METSSETIAYVPSCTLKKLNAIFEVSFAGVGMQQCAICKSGLMEPSIDYQANPSPSNTSGLMVAKGGCGHGYHLDCIQRWLKNRSSCPLCNHEWELVDTFKISS